jgi:hypothetical protein
VRVGGNHLALFKIGIGIQEDGGFIMEALLLVRDPDVEALPAYIVFGPDEDGGYFHSIGLAAFAF